MLGKCWHGHSHRLSCTAHGSSCCACHAADPAADYEIVRQELALYNPGYCARPHVVALNKMDLPDAAALAMEVQQDILDAARRMQVPSLQTCLTCFQCMYSKMHVGVCVCAVTAEVMDNRQEEARGSACQSV